MADEYAGEEVGEEEYAGRPAGTTAGNVTASIGGGFNVGLGEAVGAPVDLMNLGLGMIGLGSQEPFGGSQSIQRGLSHLGMTPAPGEPYPIPAIGRITEEVGAGTGMLMPFMGAAQRGTGAAQAARGLASQNKSGALKQAMIDPAIRMAQQSPKALVAAETAAATSAGMGAAAANALFPGDPTAELVGQLAGGFLNPTGLMVSQGPRVARGAKNIVYPFTPTGAKRQAAGRIQEVAQSPQESLRKLKEYGRTGQTIPGERLTPAQITGDPGLIALERAAARSSAEIEGRLGEMAASTNRALMEEAADIRTPTDPSEVKRFLEQRRGYTEKLIDIRLQNAALRARQRVEELAPDMRPRQANEIAREELDKALRDARSTEKDKWSKVPTDIESPTGSAKSALAGFETGRGKAADPEDIPEFVRRHLRELTEKEAKDLEEKGEIADKRVFLDGEPIQELRDLRSRVLREARDERGQTAPNWNKIRLLDDIADGLLDDMAATPGANPALDTARDFSRQLNQKFTQGPVGRILGYERVGGATTPAELTLERSVGRMGPTGAVNAEALMRAVGDNPETMGAAAQDYLRSTFLQQVDPTNSGAINPRSAQTWLGRNEELMSQFPALRQQFEEAATSADAAKALQAQSKARTQAIGDRLKSSTSMYIKAQPGQEIARIRALGGNQTAAMRSLVNSTRKDPTGNALRGLKSAYVEDLMRRSFSRFEDLQGQDMLDGGEMLNLLNQDKAITGPLLAGSDMKRLTQIAQRAEAILNARRTGRDIDEILESAPSALFDMLARISGAQIGGRLGQGGATGTPLVAAGAGSRFMRSVTEKIPLERVSDVLTQAALDDKLMADLLARVDTDVKAAPVGRKLNAWLINAIPEYEDVFGEGEPLEIDIHPGGYEE